MEKSNHLLLLMAYFIQTHPKHVNPFYVNLDYSNCSPFIGRKTCEDVELLNTEHRKISRETNDVETDTQEMCEEMRYVSR